MVFWFMTPVWQVVTNGYVEPAASEYKYSKRLEILKKDPVSWS
jgi:hypothetical protein